MASSHSTDPKTLAPEALPLSHGVPTAGEEIGSSADRFDDAQEKADQLAREIEAVLRNPRIPTGSASTTDPAENLGKGDNLSSATAQEYAASLTELQQRFDTLVFEHSEIRRERDELARQLASTASASAEGEPRNAEMEKSLHSIRQARDTVLARNVALTEKLTAAEERIAELEDELERARGAAQTLSETCDELRQKTLELARARDQLNEQGTNLVEDSQDRCTGENPATSNIATCEVAQVSRDEPLNPSENSVALAATQACLELLAVDVGNREILAELEDRFHNFGERARSEGCAALGHLSAVCEQLTGWLKKTPGKIAENIEPLASAVGLLGEIAAIDEPRRITDPADALVYSLDGDVDNCECLAMAMEKIALKARYATKPEVALKDLTAESCDLIILDLDLPDMNSFDLFALVRALGKHEKTPVIFLSGVTASEGRAAELGDNAHVFVRKPYNLNTLGLITLCMILKARLAALDEEPARGRNAKRRPCVKA